MRSLAKGFDRLALFYDSLAKFFIGKGIRSSQLIFLNHLAKKNRLLILGGGTGWILPYIFDVNSTLHIDYIELSSKMLSKARLNGQTSSAIRFIEGTESVLEDDRYDCVITNFYLDLFDDHELPTVVARIKKSLRPNTCWIATDFVEEKAWHKVAVKIMYSFFSLTTGLKTGRLPKWETHLVRAGGRLIESNASTRGFIKSVVFNF